MNGAAVSYDKKFKVYHICVKEAPKEKEGEIKKLFDVIMVIIIIILKNK